jgi:hypothetical protein
MIRLAVTTTTNKPGMRMVLPQWSESCEPGLIDECETYLAYGLQSVRAWPMTLSKVT